MNWRKGFGWEWRNMSTGTFEVMLTLPFWLTFPYLDVEYMQLQVGLKLQVNSYYSFAGDLLKISLIFNPTLNVLLSISFPLSFSAKISHESKCVTSHHLVDARVRHFYFQIWIDSFSSHHTKEFRVKARHFLNDYYELTAIWPFFWIHSSIYQDTFA